MPGIKVLTGTVFCPGHDPASIKIAVDSKASDDAILSEVASEFNRVLDDRRWDGMVGRVLRKRDIT